MNEVKGSSQPVVNKRPIYLFGSFLLIAYLIIAFVMMDKARETVIESKLSNLSQQLLYQDALRTYIAHQLKPVFFELQHESKLSPDFFDSRALSGTYITRHIFSIFDDKLHQKQLTSWHYRLAAKAPRNPINLATEEELALLEKFNQDRTLKRFQEVKWVEGEEVLYVASPMGETTPDCLQCHGDPSWAPQDMVNKYGPVRGFYENVGEIRAFISYSYNLTESIASAKQTYMWISLILLVFFITIFGSVSFAYVLDQKKKLLVLKQQKELDFVAHHDFLTQLNNRHALNRDFPDALERFADGQTLYQSMWVMMLDLDHFKLINDDFGHDVGDKVLVALARLFEKQIATCEGAEVYRIGGEEFLITLPGLNSVVVERLFTAMQAALQTIEIKGLNRTLSLSAGATEVLRGEVQFSVLKRADGALYQAKNNGRAQLHVA
ncbi:MAG: diguanylate cyclase [Thiotrichales bacterium]|nr:diguanylate cyclase [Thiotrichales bacterium]